jgi:hypothetical protein
MAIEYLTTTVPELKRNGSESMYVQIEVTPLLIKEETYGNITCQLAGLGEIIDGEIPTCLETLSNDGLYKIHGLWEKGTFYIHQSEFLHEFKSPEKPPAMKMYSDEYYPNQALRDLRRNRERKLRE